MWFQGVTIQVILALKMLFHFSEMANLLIKKILQKLKKKKILIKEYLNADYKMAKEFALKFMTLYMALLRKNGIESFVYLAVVSNFN